MSIECYLNDKVVKIKFSFFKKGVILGQIGRGSGVVLMVVYCFLGVIQCLNNIDDYLVRDLVRCQRDFVFLELDYLKVSRYMREREVL